MITLGKSIAFLFSIIFFVDLYFGIRIISACVRGMGENGCIGMSGFEYIFLAPLLLLVIILSVIYGIRYHEEVSVLMMCVYSLLAIALLTVPYVFTAKIQEAYLFRSSFLIFDFQNVHFDFYKDFNKIKSFSDCDAFMHGADECKKLFILKNNLSMEGCDSIQTNYRYQCRYDVMKQNNYSNIDIDFCKKNFYDSTILPGYPHYQHCVAKVASLQNNPQLCRILENIGNREDPDNFRNFYVKGCYSDIKENNF